MSRDVEITGAYSWLLNPSADIKSALSKANKDALADLAEQVIADTRPYVPKKTGQLRDSAHIDGIKKGEITITYSRPLTVKYKDGSVEEFDDIAESVYEGINPVTGNPIENWTTDGAEDHWTVRSLIRNKKTWYDKFTRKWQDSFRHHK